MELQLLDKLVHTSEFDHDFMQLLRDYDLCLARGWVTQFKRLELYLVSLVCQNKNLAHYNSSSAEKATREACLEELTTFLGNVIQTKRASRDHVAQLFVEHLSEHNHCLTSLGALAKLLTLVPEFAQNFLRLNLVYQLGWLFETVSAKLVKEKQQQKSGQKPGAGLCYNLEKHIRWLQENNELKPVIPRTPKANPPVASSVEFQVQSIKIPPLNLPLLKLQHGECLSKSTRRRGSLSSSSDSSSRRRERSARIQKESEEESRKPPLEAMLALASDLGQAYFSVDLSYLLTIKRKTSPPCRRAARQHVSEHSFPRKQQNKGLQVVGGYLRLLELVSDYEYEQKDLTNPLWLSQLVKLLCSPGLAVPLLAEEASGVQSSMLRLLDLIALLSQGLHRSLLLILHENEKEKTPMQRRKVVFSDSMLSGEELQRRRVSRSLLAFFGIQAVEPGALCEYKAKSNAFLLKFKAHLAILLEANLRLPDTYLSLSHSLCVLAHFLATTTSRIARREALESFLPQVLLLKRMLLELSLPFFQVLRSTSHRTIPSKKLSESKLEDDGKGKRKTVRREQASTRPKQSRQPLVLQFPPLLPAFLSVLAQLLNEPTKQHSKLLVGLFVESDQFKSLVQQYCNFMFQGLGQSPGSKLHSDAIVVVFRYYSACALALSRSKQRTSVSKRFLLSIHYLYREGGPVHESFVGLEQPVPSGWVRAVAKEAVELTQRTTALLRRGNPLLGQEVGTRLVRTCYLGFVKLYSKICLREMSQSGTYGPDEFWVLCWFVRVMVALADNRTEAVSRRLFQYKIMEFFCREISLEARPPPEDEPEEEEEDKESSPPTTQNRQSLSLKFNVPLLKLPKREEQTSSALTIAIPSLKVQSQRFVSERQTRTVYQDEQLHSSIIILLLTLLIDQGGRLDETYCDQFPMASGKMNVLFVLQNHLNHSQNCQVVDRVLARLESMPRRRPMLRLLKLMVERMTVAGQYSQWTKIAAGAYGVIYRAKCLNGPTVAIKQMNHPKSQYDRCVLHDVYNEVNILQSMSQSGCVVELYEYGVTDSSYMIVLREYSGSLRRWREALGDPPLHSCLAAFREVLRAVQTLHANNITHYDLKADNFLVEEKPGDGVRVVLADFGEAKCYRNEGEELDVRSRGTDCIKSPQMLTLALQTKKESEKYDRRKKVGSTRASDIWSVGCLFYQVLTGDFLFASADWVKFYLRVTSAGEPLLNDDNVSKLGANPYLLDFLKFMLVRDPQHRPTIAALVRRFDNVVALLSRPFFDPPPLLQPAHTLEQLVEEFQGSLSQARHPGPCSTAMHQGMLQILEDLWYCSQEKFEPERAIRSGVTHLVCSSELKIKHNRFIVLGYREPKNLAECPFRLAPRVCDFIREALHYRGRVLFVRTRDNVVPTLLLYVLCLLLRVTYFQLQCLLSTQQLLFRQNVAAASIAIFAGQALHVAESLDHFPRLQCVCGVVTFVLKRSYQEFKKCETWSCRCTGKETCMPGGCKGLLEEMAKSHGLDWEAVRWAVMPPNSLLVGPFKTGKFKENAAIQLLTNSADCTEKLMEAGSRSKAYRCRVCLVPMCRLDSEGRVVLVMNNEQRGLRLGLLGRQGQDRPQTPQLREVSWDSLRKSDN